MAQEKQSLTLEELIKIADEAYPDGGLVMEYSKDPDGAFGDDLARFIAMELESTFDPEADRQRQLDTAAHTLERAIYELDDVLRAFCES